MPSQKVLQSYPCISNKYFNDKGQLRKERFVKMALEFYPGIDTACENSGITISYIHQKRNTVQELLAKPAVATPQSAM